MGFEFHGRHEAVLVKLVVRLHVLRHRLIRHAVSRSRDGKL